jgi:hypothetical protein
MSDFPFRSGPSSQPGFELYVSVYIASCGSQAAFDMENKNARDPCVDLRFFEIKQALKVGLKAMAFKLQRSLGIERMSVSGEGRNATDVIWLQKWRCKA